MAQIRSLTLEEWFLTHQLDALGRERFHLPFHLDIDVTELWDALAAAGRPRMTAAVVKAAGLLVTRRPVLNRTLFRTPIGLRLVEHEGSHVNVPFVLHHAGVGHVAATVVRDAATRDIAAIAAELDAARHRDISTYPINRMFVANRNTWFNRLRLRVIHWAVYRLPWVYTRGGGGGISVSSLLHRDRPGASWTGASFGPNAITLGLWSCKADDSGRRTLRLTVAWDHHTMPGDVFMEALGELDDILRRPRESGLLPPISAVTGTEPVPGAPALG